MTASEALLKQATDAPVDLREVLVLLDLTIAAKRAALASIDPQASCRYIVSCGGTPLTFDLDPETKQVSNPTPCEPEKCILLNKADAEKPAAMIRADDQPSAIVVPAVISISAALRDAVELRASVAQVLGAGEPTCTIQ